MAAVVCSIISRISWTVDILSSCNVDFGELLSGKPFKCSKQLARFKSEEYLAKHPKKKL